MKCGTIGYATDSGLGILIKSFVDAGIVTDVLVVRHSRHTTHDHWYPNAKQLSSVKSTDAKRTMGEFVSSMDAMIYFETPWDWSLFEMDVPSALVTMHECTPEHITYFPDAFWCPSALDCRAFQKYADRADVYNVQIPVDPSTWKLRERAKVFVHNAGHGGLKGRNGTAELVEAIRHVKSEAKFLIRSQDVLRPALYADRQDRVYSHVGYGTFPYDQLYTEGDVFIFPEKFNGLSLPLQESRAAGMLVMTTDRFPNNEWLPVRPLIKPVGYVKNRIGPPYMEFDEALLEPRTIAEKIDEMYDKDISNYSLDGKKWAEENSWEALKPKYMNLLEKLVS